MVGGRRRGGRLVQLDSQDLGLLSVTETDCGNGWKALDVNVYFSPAVAIVLVGYHFALLL